MRSPVRYGQPSIVSSYLGMQLGGVRSTSHVANNFMGTGFDPPPPAKLPSAEDPDAIEQTAVAGDGAPVPDPAAAEVDAVVRVPAEGSAETAGDGPKSERPAVPEPPPPELAGRNPPTVLVIANALSRRPSSGPCPRGACNAEEWRWPRSMNN